MYDYTPNRSRDGPDEFLKDFHGYLQADAYSGYDQIYKEAERGITEVACMAHARRKYFEAQSSDIMRSTVMLAYYPSAVRRRARGARQAVGRRRTPGAASGAKSADAGRHQGLSGARAAAGVAEEPDRPGHGLHVVQLGGAGALREDGDLEIDNNGAERSLRGVAVGRRNWTFFGSDNGGRTAAVLSSLIATCKRHHIDPFAYLRDVFARISAHPQSRLAELLPDQWKAAPEQLGDKEGG